MSISSKKLSEKQHEQVLSEPELFTDREIPQESFERKLGLIGQYRTDAYGVLCFYGIGGIGKTSLMNKLIRLMDHSVDPILAGGVDGYHAKFDFGAEGIEKDKMTMLTSLRNQLVDADPRFRFVLFDAARLFYLKKLGVDVDSDREMSFVLEKNVWLKSAVSALGMVPVVGWVSSAAQAIDAIIAGIGEKVEENNKKYKARLKSISAMEPSELIKSLHVFFAEDLRINVSTHIEKPIVVFLDTYEKFVDSLESDALRIDIDHWLRKGEKSLIQSVPGVLWVIMGREKLDWREDDGRNWDEEFAPEPELLSEEEKCLQAENDLEQHLLGDLSEKDALVFFEKAGIKDRDLSRKLFRLTNGTPLYMDICVRHYYDLGQEAADPDSFGSDLDELINRYLKNMPPHFRQMLCVMSVLEKWNDGSFHEVVGRMEQREWFTQARYEEFLRHSFIIRNAAGECYVHETVRTACVQSVHPQLAMQIHRAALHGGRDFELTHHSVYPGCSYGDALQCWDQIRDALAENYRLGKYENNIILLEDLYRRVKEVFPDSGYRYAVGCRLAYWLSKDGKLSNALEFLETECSASMTGIPGMACECCEKLILLCAQTDRVLLYAALEGRREEALRLGLVTYRDLKELAGENDRRTLECLGGIGEVYAAMGDYEKSRKIERAVYLKRKDILGEKHPDTISSLQSFADADFQLRGEKKSLEKVYEMQKEVLGEDHPETIRTFRKYFAVNSNQGEQQKSQAMDLDPERVKDLRGEKGSGSNK
ncbi:MAG: tetratricopeptide repeat protein [Lachnospiraceae bacterium]|nr:tetratricopeptide repeat protein [Lachnospiraceae bacterium]